MADICLTHTDREATTRCATCFKPLCAECAQTVEGNEFCSPKCSENFAKSADRFAAAAELKEISDRLRARTQIKRAVIIVIIIGAVVGTLVARPDLRKKLMQKLGVAKNAIEKKVR